MRTRCITLFPPRRLVVFVVTDLVGRCGRSSKVRHLFFFRPFFEEGRLLLVVCLSVFCCLVALVFYLVCFFSFGLCLFSSARLGMKNCCRDINGFCVHTPPTRSSAWCARTLFRDFALALRLTDAERYGARGARRGRGRGKEQLPINQE